MSALRPVASSTHISTFNLSRHLFAPPHSLNKLSLRQFATKFVGPLHDIKNVAVLGGGITGLATAFYLSRRLPDCSVILLEQESRLGGWLQSEYVDVGTGKVVFEKGPRSLRPSFLNGLVTLDLIDELGLGESLVLTSKSSPAAHNRYIYYPDHLVRMPGPGVSLLNNVLNVWSESIFKGVYSGLFKGIFVKRKPHYTEDESIGSFISRHFGQPLADNIVSAVFHGIYAGDIYKLSARALLPRLWHMEERYGSVVLGALEGMVGAAQPLPVEDSDLVAMRKYRTFPSSSSSFTKQAKQSSVYTFKGGLSELKNSLYKAILPSVNIRLNTEVRRVEMIGEAVNAKMRVYMRNSTQPSSPPEDFEDFTHVVSTIPGNQLADIAEHEPLSPSPLGCLRTTGSVTVMVVNLFYTNPSLLSVRGFGYLLPRSVPLQQNPHRALGVVFDSETSGGQDSTQGTKVTVMLGGHWWNDEEGFPDKDLCPDEEKGAMMAKAVLKQHLGIGEEPAAVHVSLQRNCIPQYQVGHDLNMQGAHQTLQAFDGRLRVAGCSYTGVGVNDCIRAANDVVRGLIDGVAQTGLDSFQDGRKWIWVSPQTLRTMQR